MRKFTPDGAASASDDDHLRMVILDAGEKGKRGVERFLDGQTVQIEFFGEGGSEDDWKIHGWSPGRTQWRHVLDVSLPYVLIVFHDPYLVLPKFGKR